MRKCEIERNETDDTVTIMFTSQDGKRDSLTLYWEEWESLLRVIPPRVSIQEVRPMFALFGTRTIVKWVGHDTEGGRDKEATEK